MGDTTQPEVDGELHVGPDHEAAFRRLEEIQRQTPWLVETLLACQPHSRDHRPAAPKLAGVYLFRKNGVHRYVGRTRNFSRRFGEHVARKSAQNKAAFAFNIAEAAVAGLALVPPGLAAGFDAGAAHDADIRSAQLEDPRCHAECLANSSEVMEDRGERSTPDPREALRRDSGTLGRYFGDVA